MNDDFRLTVLMADEIYKDTCTLCGKQNKDIRAIIASKGEEERACERCLFELASWKSAR